MKANYLKIIGAGLLSVATWGGAAEPKAPTSPKAPAAPEAPKRSKAAVSVEKLFPDTVVAKGKGVEIKQSQIDDAFVDYKANLAANGQTVPEEKRATVEADIVERLIFARLLMLRATEVDKVMGKDLATKTLSGSKQNAGSEEAFKRQLATTGKTLQQVTDRLAEQATCEEVLNRELKAKILVTDAQAKKYYDENGPRFEQPEALRVTHILVSIKDQATKQDLSDDEKKAKKKKAEKLLAEVKGGADFSKLAKESSDDPRAKENGGAYTFTRGQMPPEFEAAAYSMKPDQISDLVATDYGYHIIKLHEHLPKKKVPLAEIAPKIKEALQRQELETQLPIYYQKLRKDAGIEVVGEKSK